MAWAATKLFLRFNGFLLRVPSPEVGERFVLEVVDGSLAASEIADRLASWSTPA